MTGSKPMTFLARRAGLPIAAFFALLLCALAALPAFAADQQSQEVSPEQLALARKYVELTDKSGVYETTIVQAGLNTYKTLLRQNPKAADQLNKAIENVISTYKGRKDELFDRFARVYALTFSKDELQQIVDFYGSPTGQKLATANADLNSSIARVLNIYSTNLQSEFFAAVRAELKTMGVDM